MSETLESISQHFKNLSSHLNSKVRSHVLSVYSHILQMLILSSFAAYLDLNFNLYLLSNSFLSAIATIGCAVGFYLTPATPNNLSMRKYLSFGFSFFQGLSIAPLLSTALYFNPSIVFTALSSTVMIFASFSISVLLTPSPQFMYVGGLVGSGLSLMGWLSLINFFMGSSALFSFELYLGLFVFSLFVIYDTQLMISKAEAGSTDHLKHAMELYSDFVSIFVRILLILQKKENEKDKKKKR